MPTNNTLHIPVAEALREQYGRLASDARVADGVPHFSVRFPAASIPYRVIVIPIANEGSAPLVHVETLVAEALDWDAPGVAQALLAENRARVLAHYSRSGDALVVEGDLPAHGLDAVALAGVVNAVAEVAVIGRDLLARAGLLASEIIDSE